jgi:predicted nuclease of restriction endonuclease-like (RecB) superfamily
VEKQKTASWGSGFIDRFSKYLKESFPDIAGFSPKNLRYCRTFYSYYNDPEIWQQVVAKLEKTDNQQKWQQSVVKKDACRADDVIPLITGQIPWGHNIHIFTKAKSFDEALFYINETIENGWSRDILALQIKSNLYVRQGKAITNFKYTLASPQSDLAQQTIKYPYTLRIAKATGFIGGSIEYAVGVFLKQSFKGNAFPSKTLIVIHKSKYKNCRVDKAERIHHFRR